jgi:hypothetical protein
LTRYIAPYVEEILGDYQRGFQKGQSTTDQIFCLRTILEKTCEYNAGTCQLYTGYTQAYDSINRAEVVEIMKEFGIPIKLVRLVKPTLASTNNRVKMQGKLLPSFEMAVGLRQGDFIIHSFM